MSYDVYIYHTDVYRAVVSGKMTDEVTHTPFSDASLIRFKERAVAYGYGAGQVTPLGIEHSKEVAGCPIQLSIYAGEIAFGVPYWTNNTEALQTMLQDSSDLADDTSMARWDPQVDEWTVT